MYLYEVRKVEATRSLALIEAASYPYLKKSDRRKVDRKYERIFKADVKVSPKRIDSTWSTLRKRYRQMVASKKVEGSEVDAKPH